MPSKRSSLVRFFAVVATAGIVSACGGGGGGGGSLPAASGGNPTSAPTAGPVTSQSQTVPVSTGLAETANYSLTGYSGSATIPTGSVATTLATTFSTTQPGGTPTVQSVSRRPKNIGASPLSAVAFLCATPAATVTLSSYPSFTLTVPAAVAAAGPFDYIALYDPTNAAAGWTTVEGPASVSGSTLTFTGGAPGPTLRGGQTYCLVFFTLASALPAATATPTATPTGSSATAYTCPPSDAVANSVARTGFAATSAAGRRMPAGRTARPAFNSGLLAVTYSAAVAGGARAAAVAAREQAAGASVVQQFSFARTGKVVHVLSVAPGQASAVAAALRAQEGVESVAPTGVRYTTSVTTPYFPNDPYFNGFTLAQNTGAGNPQPSTYHVGPYEEAANVPGQWDMHAIGLENAFAYSQNGNGSGITNAAALGSASVKLAIIDTGEDPNHPELASKIVYQKCFISNPSGDQSTSNFETDELGHGTNVSGIAAADTNNALGFTGTGGNVQLYAYRVFPTPDDNCASESTTDNQCFAQTPDIAAAIEDAVAQGVNVISMSLGGAACSSPGVDSDPVEGAAIADAIAHNVIVIAASGNSGASAVGTPACDAGVIAVGATSLADGNPNASGNHLGTPAAPVEYVTSYTQYGSPGANLRNAAAWGIVAPGGDASSGSDSDDLHWIENIWTTTPFDQNFEAYECSADYPGTSATGDCRTLIAGTSMATPHVAGAAALILSVNATYQSPAAMKALLCQTADDIGGNQGCGRLNVYTAMAHALSDPSPPTPVP